MINNFFLLSLLFTSFFYTWGACANQEIFAQEESEISQNQSIQYFLPIRPENLLQVIKKQQLPNDGGSRCSFSLATIEENANALLSLTNNALPILTFSLNKKNDPDFEGTPPFDSLEYIFVKNGEKKRLIRSLTVENIAPPGVRSWSDSIVEITPLYDNSKCKEIYRSRWLRPFSLNSDDIVRYAIKKEEITDEALLDLLEKEYPDLQLLFSSYSVLDTSSTMKRRALYRLYEFQKQKDFIDSHPNFFQKHPNFLGLLKLTLIFQEIGQPVTSLEEPPITTLSILMTALNRFGCSQKEILLAQTLVQNKSFHSFTSPNSSKTTKHALKKTLVLAKTCYEEDLANLSKRQPLEIANTYIWEKIDPKHRFGADVQKARDKYEKYFLKKSAWTQRFWSSGRTINFWEWLDNKCKRSKIPIVHFYSPEERRNTKITIFDGKVIFQENQKPDDLKLLMFVEGTDGEIYIAKKIEGEDGAPAFTHGSFFACEPIYMAGKMSLLPDGTIIEITNHSGHYRPGKKELIQFLEQLQNKGVSLKGVRLHINLGDYQGNKEIVSDAEAWLAQFHTDFSN